MTGPFPHFDLCKICQRIWFEPACKAACACNFFVWLVQFSKSVMRCISCMLNAFCSTNNSMLSMKYGKLSKKKYMFRCSDWFLWRHNWLAETPVPAKGYFIAEVRFKMEVVTSAHLWLFALTRALYVAMHQYCRDHCNYLPFHPHISHATQFNSRNSCNSRNVRQSHNLFGHSHSPRRPCWKFGRTDRKVFGQVQSGGMVGRDKV